MTRRNNADAVVEELRAFGLSYPGAHLKSPWPGHKDLAVRDKTFAYLSVEGQPFSIACKLPRSNAAALMLPFSKPAEYGLGKSGWVSAVFSAGETLPVDMLKEWIDESYRAQAPRKLVATLGVAKRESVDETGTTTAKGRAAKATNPTTMVRRRRGRQRAGNQSRGRR